MFIPYRTCKPSKAEPTPNQAAGLVSTDRLPSDIYLLKCQFRVWGVGFQGLGVKGLALRVQGCVGEAKRMGRSMAIHSPAVLGIFPIPATIGSELV